MTVCRLLLIVFLLLTPTASATIGAASPGEIDFAALDAAIAAQMAKHGLPGAALAVVEGGGIVYLKGYGSAGRRAMAPQTPMFIGSQSKSFTALAAAQLAEQGKLDLNAPVRTYIPWFRVADEAASGQITINHLLHHTSGLSESGYSVILPADATTEEAVRSLAQARLTAPVGTKHQYFNIGYDVLTYDCRDRQRSKLRRLSPDARVRPAGHESLHRRPRHGQQRGTGLLAHVRLPHPRTPNGAPV